MAFSFTQTHSNTAVALTNCIRQFSWLVFSCLHADTTVACNIWKLFQSKLFLHNYAKILILFDIHVDLQGFSLLCEVTATDQNRVNNRCHGQTFYSRRGCKHGLGVPNFYSNSRSFLIIYFVLFCYF